MKRGIFKIFQITLYCINFNLMQIIVQFSASKGSICSDSAGQYFTVLHFINLLIALNVPQHANQKFYDKKDDHLAQI